uniref:Uncharacterized protein n=1 Tax=Arundo donax TaxID=35708 RepID=A0A0A9CMH7_ARUDO
MYTVCIKLRPECHDFINTVQRYDVFTLYLCWESFGRSLTLVGYYTLIMHTHRYITRQNLKVDFLSKPELDILDHIFVLKS